MTMPNVQGQVGQAAATFGMPSVNLMPPEIAEAAVIGVPDRIRGEIPVAYLVVRQPVDPAVLEARCRDNLASFKVPRSFVIVESLPRTALGKVKRDQLPRAL